ncbi:MAG: hypothetical protein ON057_001773 [Glomeribacter sp. 1016415]|nr:hypothetical protein [Glomeribacter sp. 1016415]
MPFKKGKSGNPGGRPKEITHVRELARQHTTSAVATLVQIMHDPQEKAQARVSAAKELLDRGFGRPPQDIDVKSDGKALQSGVLAIPVLQGEWEQIAPAMQSHGK